MSGNVPFEIQVEIMKWLPVKSLIQFRSVSKTWKSMIDSSGFVAEYSRQHTHTQHILVRYDDLTDCRTRYVSIVDDATFPTRRVSIPCPHMRESYRIVGCSHGLFCLYRVGHHDDPGKAVLWNPSIRKTIDVVVPNVTNGETYETVFGFGVCRETNDPKIVKITHIISRSDVESASCVPWQVEVFTLSTGAWRRLGDNLPRKLIYFHFDANNACSVVIDGVIYWFATDLVTMAGSSCHVIISFDITSEEFGEVTCPNRLAHSPSTYGFSIFKLKESLVVLDDDYEDDRIAYDVWLMEGGVPKSFTKLSTINLNRRACARALGKSGEYIIEIVEGQRGHLVVYDPHSKQIDHLGIDGLSYTIFVHPYMETLCLLDQPNHIVHNESET